MLFRNWIKIKLNLWFRKANFYNFSNILLILNYIRPFLYNDIVCFFCKLFLFCIPLDKYIFAFQ